MAERAKTPRPSGGKSTAAQRQRALRQARRAEGWIELTHWLTPARADKARELGGGNPKRGVDRAIDEFRG